MYISSLYAFTRFLAPEDVPYVFTFDNTGKMPQFLTWRLFYVIITVMSSILTMRGTYVEARLDPDTMFGARNSVPAIYTSYAYYK